MPIELNDLKNHKAIAKKNLADWESHLTSKGMDKNRFKNDTKWRKISSQIKKIQGRIGSYEKKVELAKNIGKPSQDNPT